MYLGYLVFVLTLWDVIDASPASKATQCELPEDIPNGQYRIIHGTDFVTGTTIKYTCNEGYNMMSRVDIRTCLIGGWDNHLPQCEEIRCTVEKTDEHLVTTGLLHDDSRVKYGHKLHFKCDSPKLVLRGPKLVSCSTDGKWSSPFPTCGENSTCGLPPAADFADVTDTLKGQYEDGERVEYQCQTFYTISENPYMTCSNGQWTGTIRCMKPCTVTTEEMDQNKIHLAHGRHRKMYSEHLDFISFKCNWWKSLQADSPGLRQQCMDGVMTLPRCA
ncbi:complement factor H-like isoform X2 [Chanos chanos]|uniref:Complement factor H-like isoform X2 n=1 Tax=Chanos chanos TaxID=29144 RepID=A0A6J2W825_CHACN|nr:complement factor H-like isoform X2 [Chanos chanos]